MRGFGKRIGLKTELQICLGIKHWSKGISGVYHIQEA